MAARSKSTASRRSAKSARSRKSTGPAKWSKGVTERSDAMDLKTGVFKLKSAKAIARSVKRSAERSHRRKSSPFRSAMSMLNFEMNRAGKNLTEERRRVLNQAKEELRKAFGRPV
jgi:hypothetical protein